MIFNKLLYYVRWIRALLFLRKHGFWDIHVHARDMNQWEKFTIREWFKLAEKYGVRFAAFMPNTDPAIVDRDTLERYIKLAKESNHNGMKFMIWIGLTSEEDQIREAVKLYNEYSEYIIGLKMYAGSSTGNLGIITEQQQRKVYTILSKLNYKGVLAVHCEEDALMYPEKFDPQKPETWNFARPVEAEISSVNQNIRLANECNFEGWLHICHVSSFISVNIINQAKKEGMKISCGVTLQHLIFDTEQIADMDMEDGLELKCNPPIRGCYNRKMLLLYLKLGFIDIIESDFAPHTKADKFKRHASGVHNYKYWPDVIIELRANGFSDQRIAEVLRNRVIEIFKRINLKKVSV